MCKFKFSKFIGKDKKLELWDCVYCDNWKHIIDGEDVTDYSRQFECDWARGCEVKICEN